MSTESQVRMFVTAIPGAPGYIAWEMRDSERRVGYGKVAADDWAEIRCIQVRAGISEVVVHAANLSDGDKAQVMLRGWDVKFTP